MRKTCIYYSLVALCCLYSAAMAAMPRLTVVAVVDGLTEDNLSMLRPYWQQGGLRTLSEEAYQTTVLFPHQVYGGNETTATLMTGATPSEHGYTMDRYFLRRDRRPHAMLEDSHVSGIGTSLTLSPQTLMSQTISDRMRMQYPAAKIYAVGIQPETTILLAGHAANACSWLDADQQRWVTTTYYSEGLPSAADQQNVAMRIQTLAAREWMPRMDIPTYNHPTEQERKQSFSYIAGDVLARSPEANTLVIELALAIQQSEQMGKSNRPDLLLLHLNTLSPKATSDHIQSAEQEDMYLWLNQDLGYLMEQLDRRIGHNNYQLLVVGRPVLGADQQTMSKARMAIQPFNVDRAAALTSAYLMALYGHERWVDGGYGQSIYLNRTLIEQKRLDLEKIQRQVANFLMDFEGVQIAVPQHEAWTLPALSTTLCKRHAGDVVFSLQPGWQLMQDERRTIDNVVDANPSAPLLFWSGSLRAMPEGRLTALDVANIVF